MNMMGNGYYNGGYDMNNPYGNGFFQSQPMFFNNQPQPELQSSLTNEEIQALKADRPGSSVLNLNVDKNDVIRAMCNHRFNSPNGNGFLDAVQYITDGSNDVYCPICGERWHLDELTKEDVQMLIKQLIDSMQNAKWAGNIPISVTRDYFAMIPLLRKYPDLYEYSMKNFNRAMNQNGMYYTADAMPYAQYDAMFPGGSASYMNPYQGGYGYYQQGYMNPPQGGVQFNMPYQMNQQMGQVGQVANPNVNPMQAQQGGYPQYNQQQMMNYGPGPNPAFYQQQMNGMPSQMNMQQMQAGGMQQQQAYQPTFQTAQQQQVKQPQPPQQNTVTTDTKVEL